jgi:hypothetical protein
MVLIYPNALCHNVYRTEVKVILFQNVHMANNDIIGDERPRALGIPDNEISIVQTTETKHWSSEQNKTIKGKAAYTWDNIIL